MVSWDPATYLDFSAERGRPFHDLLARVDSTDPHRVVDLGCGPGQLAGVLTRRWPLAHILGVDSSPEMITRAGAHAEPGQVEFELADLQDWAPTPPVDVIVTNATLQWVPGHLELLPRWVDAALRPGGWLALQVPGNLDDPLHSLLRSLCRSPRWAAQLGDAEAMRADVPDPVGYAEVLAGAGCRVDAWETTYLHILDPEGRFGPDAVLAWAMGTALRPVLDLLRDNGSDGGGSGGVGSDGGGPDGGGSDGSPDDRKEFIESYAELLRAAYPRQSWGTPLPFRRIFAVAQKAARA